MDADRVFSVLIKVSASVTLNIVIDVLYLVIVLMCLLISYVHISLIMDH